jgi:hypothetical protein
MNSIIAHFCALTIAFSAHAQSTPDNRILEREVELSGISGTLVISPSDPEVGMPIVMTLSISGDAVPTAQFPVFEEEFGAFDVRSLTPLQMESSGGNVRGIEVVLIGYESGEIVLPPITITTNGRELTFDDVTVNVTSLVGSEAGPDEYRDIQNAVTVPLATQSPIVWILMALCAAVITGLFIWWLLARSRGEKPIEPAHTWALKRLDHLEAKSLPRQGELKGFFFELTDIARTYIERRFDIDAPDRTTQEFIAESQRHPELDPSHAKLLGRFLKSADMVKFAGDRPADSECDRSMEFIRTFVTECGPRPEKIGDDAHELFTENETTSPPSVERVHALGLEHEVSKRVSTTERISR